MKADRSPGDRYPYAWREFTCPCGATVATMCPQTRLCSDCRGRVYERIAAAIDPTLDPAADNDWWRVWGVQEPGRVTGLQRLWCWPLDREW